MVRSKSTIRKFCRSVHFTCTSSKGAWSTLEKIFSHLYETKIGVVPSKETRQDLGQFAPGLISIMVEALRTGNIGRQLPSLVIRSGLHAGVRRNRGRQFTGNDLHDFGHATAALAYCDYFATDRSLCHLVVNDLKFDQRYQTAVVAASGSSWAAGPDLTLTGPHFLRQPDGQAPFVILRPEII